MTRDQITRLARLYELASRGPWCELGVPWADGMTPPAIIAGGADPHGRHRVCEAADTISMDEDEAAAAWGQAERDFELIREMHACLPALLALAVGYLNRQEGVSQPISTDQAAAFRRIPSLYDV